MPIADMVNAGAPSLRLLQLISSGLPVGAYTYSQGLEWAVEKGWVKDRDSLRQWLLDLLLTTMSYLEVPVFHGLYAAIKNNDPAATDHWATTLLAHRETAELRTEEQQRGRAMTRILKQLELEQVDQYSDALHKTQLAGFALAVAQWQIEPQAAISAFLWSWLENAVLVGVKIIPLGQSDGQGLLFELSAQIPQAVAVGCEVGVEEVGFSCTAQAIASSRHESQYTRLYRS